VKFCSASKPVHQMGLFFVTARGLTEVITGHVITAFQINSHIFVKVR